MMQSEKKITRENALFLIKSFAKEYRQKLGKTPGEIIFVGGGSIVLNYQFRDSTQDFDVILKTASSVKELISRFAEENDLPADWMNSDFVRTSSYSEILPEVSTHLCTLNNGTFEIRTVTGVYLIAMKLRAHREYRNDISDIIGILISEKDSENELSFDMIQSAYNRLYKENVPENLTTMMRNFCKMTVEDLKKTYENQQKMENEVSGRVMTYLDAGANIHSENVEDVVSKIKEKMGK